MNFLEFVIQCSLNRVSVILNLGDKQQYLKFTNPCEEDDSESYCQKTSVYNLKKIPIGELIPFMAYEVVDIRDGERGNVEIIIEFQEPQENEEIE